MDEHEQQSIPSSISLKQAAKTMHNRNPNIETKQRLKLANIELYSKYKTLKDLHYQKRIQNIGGNAREFYKLMRTKRKTKDYELLHEQLNDLHRMHSDDSYSALWNNWFSIEEVSEAINDLDEKKNSGLMQITAKFIKYNSEILVPFVTNMLNSILLTGIVPTE